jgi:hypothetical protein
VTSGVDTPLLESYSARMSLGNTFSKLMRARSILFGISEASALMDATLEAAGY